MGAAKSCRRHTGRKARCAHSFCLEAGWGMGQATSVVSQSASPPYSHPVRSKGASAMITRFAGTTATRSRAVAHNGIVYAVATAKNKSVPLYEQTLDALAEIDRSLADAGSHKSRILRTTV